MKEKIISVQNLTVHFEHETPLEDLTFDIYEHDVVVILGPNGAGKSTLFRALLGIVPYQGTIHLKSKKIGYLPPQESLLKKKFASSNC